MLGIGLAAGIGTGTTTLIKGPSDLKHGLDTLQMAMAQDLKALKTPSVNWKSEQERIVLTVS